MATLFFCVFEGAVEVAKGDPIQEDVVTISGTSTQSAAIVGKPNNRRLTVRVMADVACFVTWGNNPTALNDGTGGRPIPAEGVEYFDVLSGDKLAVIERT